MRAMWVLLPLHCPFHLPVATQKSSGQISSFELGFVSKFMFFGCMEMVGLGDLTVVQGVLAGKVVGTGTAGDLVFVFADFMI